MDADPSVFDVNLEIFFFPEWYYLIALVVGLFVGMICNKQRKGMAWIGIIVGLLVLVFIYFIGREKYIQMLHKEANACEWESFNRSCEPFKTRLDVLNIETKSETW